MNTSEAFINVYVQVFVHFISLGEMSKSAVSGLPDNVIIISF